MLREILKEVAKEMIVDLKMTAHEKWTYFFGTGFAGFSGIVKASQDEVVNQTAWSLADWGIFAGIVMVVINSTFQLFRLYTEVLKHRREERERNEISE